MRIVLTVPDEILREACRRITAFCTDHIVSKENLKEIICNDISIPNEPQVIDDLEQVA